MHTLVEPFEPVAVHLPEYVQAKQHHFEAAITKLKEKEEEVNRQTMELNTIELKLYKVEKDYAKNAKDLEQVQNNIKVRTEELAEFTKKDYELQIEVELAKSKLEVLKDMIKKATESADRTKAETKTNLEKLIKANYDNLVLLQRQEDNLKAVDRLAGLIIKLLADPTKQITCIEDVEACIRKPEEIIGLFFESNHQTIARLLEKYRGSKEISEAANPYFGEETSPKHPDDKGSTKDSTFLSIKQLAKVFFESKPELPRTSSQFLKPVPSLTKIGVVSRDITIPVYNIHSVVSPYDRPKHQIDNSYGASRGVGLEQNRRDSRADLFQSGFNSMLKNYRQYASHPNLDDSIVMEKEAGLNESNLDQSYVVIIDNVFVLLDNLFQRLKSHVCLVYDECAAFVEDLNLAEDHNVPKKLRQNLINLERRYNFAKVDLADLKVGRSKNIGDICLYIQRVMEFLQDEQDDFLSTSTQQCV